MSFSTVPLGPAAPPSMPPWPGSMTMVKRWPSRPVLRPRRSLFGVAWVEPVVCACTASASSNAFCERRRDVRHHAVAGRTLVRQYVELLDDERPLRLQDQARGAVVDVPVADVPDQAPRLQLPWVDRELGLRQVDHQPVRPAQQEPSRIGLAVEIHDDAHANGVARHLVVMRLERRSSRRQDAWSRPARTARRIADASAP